MNTSMSTGEAEEGRRERGNVLVGIGRREKGGKGDVWPFSFLFFSFLLCGMVTLQVGEDRRGILTHKAASCRSSFFWFNFP